MRKPPVTIIVSVLITSIVGLGSQLLAQSPPNAAIPVHATLNQLMRSVQFPLSNVIFASQADEPASIKRAPLPSAATDPLRSVFGGWQAVENSALALAESSTLLMLPGRVCANGSPVPVQDADWVRFVQGLRTAGTEAYRAAQSKSQAKMLEVSEQVSNSCSNCHRVYRRAGPEGADDLTNRCKLN